MRIVNISLDPLLLDRESVVASRVRAYGRITDRYYAIIPTPARMHVELSENVQVYGTGGGFKLVRLWRIIRFLWHKAAKKEIDIVTVQDAYFLGFTALCIARWHHLAVEVQILGLEKTTWLRTALARYVLRRVSFVRALSNKLFERLQKEYGVSPEKMKVVPIYVPVHKLGLDVRTLSAEEQEAFKEHTRQFNELYKDKFNFLTISRLVSIKNIDMQLNAVTALKEQHADIMLHIVGDGPEREHIERTVKKLQLEEHVVLHGAQYGVALGVFYMEADCFLLTSHYEGWGMVIVEAATAGLPVIMTDVGCAGELVINEEGGLVIPVADQAALGTAMERMMSEPDLKEKLAQGIITAVGKLPDFPTVLKLYKDGWEEALSRKL